MTVGLSDVPDSSTISAQLQDLTIITPSFQRPAELMKTIEYWSMHDVRLLIMDGSPNPLTRDQIRNCGDGIEYIHSRGSLIERIRSAANRITTRFVTLMPDDDVHLPSGLAAAVSALRTHPQLASCIGWAVGFSTRQGRVGSKQVLGWSAYPRLRHRHIAGPSPAQRLHDHFSAYVPSSMYSVLPRQVFINAVRLMESQTTRVYGQIEMELELATLYQGASEVLPNLHWLRNFGDADYTTADEDMNRRTMFFEAYTSESWIEWKANFLSTRSAVLASFDNENPNNVREWLQMALDRYSENCWSAVNLRQQPNYPQKLSARLKRRVPSGLTPYVRGLATSLGWSSSAKLLESYVEELQWEGMEYSKSELRNIIQHRII